MLLSCLQHAGEGAWPRPCILRALVFLWSSELRQPLPGQAQARTELSPCVTKQLALLPLTHPLSENKCPSFQEGAEGKYAHTQAREEDSRDACTCTHTLSRSPSLQQGTTTKHTHTNTQEIPQPHTHTVPDPQDPCCAPSFGTVPWRIPFDGPDPQRVSLSLQGRPRGLTTSWTDPLGLQPPCFIP